MKYSLNANRGDESPPQTCRTSKEQDSLFLSAKLYLGNDFKTSNNL